MNKAQKVLTLAALGLFLVTIFFAPWEVSIRGYTTFSGFAPLFAPPRAESGRLELRASVLLCEWIAIGLLYAGLWLCFKPVPNNPK
jgi:hypothetical protein